LRPSSLPVALARLDRRPANRTFLCWSGETGVSEHNIINGSLKKKQQKTAL